MESWEETQFPLQNSPKARELADQVPLEVGDENRKVGWKSFKKHLDQNPPHSIEEWTEVSLHKKIGVYLHSYSFGSLG